MDRPLIEASPESRKLFTGYMYFLLIPWAVVYLVGQLILAYNPIDSGADQLLQIESLMIFNQVKAYAYTFKVFHVALFTILISRYVLRANIEGFQQGRWPPNGVRLWFNFRQRFGLAAKFTSVFYPVALYAFLGSTLYYSIKYSHSAYAQMNVLEELRISITSDDNYQNSGNR